VNEPVGPAQRRRSAWRTFALFAVIGLIINVLLAWMFALLASPTSISWGSANSGLPWPMSVPLHWPSRCDYEAMGETKGLMWRSATSEIRGSGFWISCQLTEVSAGLPFRSMRWRHGYEQDGENLTRVTGNWWINVPDSVEHFLSSRTSNFLARRRIPLEPIGFGFLANTAIFGSSLWLLLRFRRTLRRWLRHRRKQCLECGSPLRVNPPANSIVADHA